MGEDTTCNALLPDNDSFAATSACNIFVGRVIARIYNINDFVVQPADAGKPYYQANEIATLLQAGIWQGWTELGTADQQAVLNQSKQFADMGQIVLAVWRNSNPAGPGHVVLIGPGPLTPSGQWNLKTPVSASFTIGEAIRAYLGLPLACAFSSDKKANIHIWTHEN